MILAFNNAFSFSFTKDSLNNKKPTRTYNTQRLSVEKPVIDGVLNDNCWKQGEWSGDFTQLFPNEGGKASQPSQIKITYDDKNIYVAIRAFDSEPKKISIKSGKRDELIGDVVGICFDSYHDFRTGFEFDVTAAGQKVDQVLTNPTNSDFNWNAVWKVKTALEDSAWTAEFEIPFNQLRYSGSDEQVWGMHVWRWIDRYQEESDWELQSLTGPGLLYLFGELRGIKGLKKSHNIEILPYTVGKVKTYPVDQGNPFARKGWESIGNVGLDAKIGLTSNFTANLTINPDFGQVESDPSVMNLSAFETFYSEKRPFFLEGKNIFNFDFDEASIFHSRRIGANPKYWPSTNDKEYLKMPDNTSILEAVKISGKSENGFSIGLLQSVTNKEKASFSSNGKTSIIPVEPLSNYVVGRIQQDFNKGTTMLGGIFTATNRKIEDSVLNFINREAYTGGIDLLHYLNDKEYFIEAKVVGSNIQGNSLAIRKLQESSAHYFQRTDTKHLHLDTMLTQLSGYGGRLKIGKGSKGTWRYSTEINWSSTGLDFNDLGYMQIADNIKQINFLQYFVVKPVSIFRTYTLSSFQYNEWDFGGNYLHSGGGFETYTEFINKMTIFTSVGYNSESLDTHGLRGGPGIITPSSYRGFLYFHSDLSKRVYYELSTNFSESNNDNAFYYSFRPGITTLPFTNLKISLNFGYSKNRDNLQYVNTVNSNNENKYILGKLSQKTISSTIRIDFHITPDLSIQYYGSPFATIGQYSNFKKVINPRATKYNDRIENLNVKVYDKVDSVSENTGNYKFDNPDFNFFQYRSNLVFRWEFRPGSQLYIVWSNEKTDGNKINYSLSNAVDRFYNAPSRSLFLIKFNYWFSI